MHTHISPDSGYLDILFAHRNKAYGAYELRNNYNQRMIRAGVLSLTIVALLAIYTLRADTGATDLVSTGEPSLVTDTTVVAIKDFIKPQEAIPAGHSGRTARTAAFADPVVVKDPITNKPIVTMPDKEALAGPVDNPGLADGTAIAMDHSLHDGPAKDLLSRRGEPNDTALATAPVADDKIRDIADEMPEFPGGMRGWKKYLSENLRYPQMARTGDIEGTVYVDFVVGKDGAISKVHVVRGLGGGCSEEAIRVLEQAPRWKAAKQKGYPVTVRMTLPIRFALK